MISAFAIVFRHGLPKIRHRTVLLPPGCGLSPRLRRDIGLEPVCDRPRVPPFAALITRV